MPTAMRRCLDCQTLIPIGKTRCGACQRRVAAGKVKHPGGRAWQRVRDAVLERDGRICWLCGQPGANTADHVLPIAHGGNDDPSNLRAAHLGCNSSRGSRGSNAARVF